MFDSLRIRSRITTFRFRDRRTYKQNNTSNESVNFFDFERQQNPNRESSNWIMVHGIAIATEFAVSIVFGRNVENRTFGKLLHGSEMRAILGIVLLAVCLINSALHIARVMGPAWTWPSDIIISILAFTYFITSPIVFVSTICAYIPQEDTITHGRCNYTEASHWFVLLISLYFFSSGLYGFIFFLRRQKTRSARRALAMETRALPLVLSPPPYEIEGRSSMVSSPVPVLVTSANCSSSDLVSMTFAPEDRHRTRHLRRTVSEETGRTETNSTDMNNAFSTPAANRAISQPQFAVSNFERSHEDSTILDSLVEDDKIVCESRNEFVTSDQEVGNI
ncbi:hypothetical protein V1511DRAFT_499356 [Dipodascopsis uninucleata]